jgi:hypothetical protein
MTQGFRLTPEVFAILSAFVEERAGLHYGLRDFDLFADKVESRATEAGFDAALDYYYFLRYDAGGEAELEALVDALAVNETYFYREAAGLRAILGAVLRPLIAKGVRPRVWCAACSTGEEPLTLAMMLAERRGCSRARGSSPATSASAPLRAPGAASTARAHSGRSLPACASDGSTSTAKTRGCEETWRTPSSGSASTWWTR